jgi:hypothetical protein
VGEFELVGGGGEVEEEEASVVAVELAGTDAVGEAEFLADAVEEGACHVGGVFVEEGEGVAAGIADASTGVADAEDGLFFGEGGLGGDALCDDGFRRGPWFPGGEAIEVGFYEGDDLVGVEVAGDGEGEVGGVEVEGVMGGEVDA